MFCRYLSIVGAMRNKAPRYIFGSNRNKAKIGGHLKLQRNKHKLPSCHGSSGEGKLSSGEFMKTIIDESSALLRFCTDGRGEDASSGDVSMPPGEKGYLFQLRTWLFLGLVYKSFPRAMLLFRRAIVADQIFFISLILFHLLGVGFGRYFCSLNSIHLIFVVD